ncbi:hypothetical protein ASE26_26590 [Duganella sp. Root198D2]|nr:hypothetical protein ASD07_06125 [Duganella sp. Root336D2]KRB95598.1 hypothetical protein ASE26_26590 [Duganella sp. Root198D2]
MVVISQQMEMVRHLAIRMADESEAVGGARDQAMPDQVIALVKIDIGLAIATCGDVVEGIWEQGRGGRLIHRR